MNVRTLNDNLPAARAWAQTATAAQVERAHRLLRVGNDASDPMVMLRMLFRTWHERDLAALVDAYFGGAPTRDRVRAFLREVVAAR